LTLVSAGRVGRPHGIDGSFWVEHARHPLGVGTAVTVGGRPLLVERRAAGDERPLVRVSAVGDRDAAAALRGELLLVDEALEEGEWLAGDLVGCRVDGLGSVRRVLEAPSCELLELDDGTLVPFIRDAVRRVDPERGVIEVDRRFIGA
jgi:16S rRNA processing protein RimM